MFVARCSPRVMNNGAERSEDGVRQQATLGKSERISSIRREQPARASRSLNRYFDLRRNFDHKGTAVLGHGLLTSRAYAPGCVPSSGAWRQIGEASTASKCANSSDTSVICRFQFTALTARRLEASDGALLLGRNRKRDLGVLTGPIKGPRRPLKLARRNFCQRDRTTSNL